MSARQLYAVFGLGLLVMAGALVFLSRSREKVAGDGPGNAGQASGDGALQEDKVIAGGPGDSLEVRHLVLKGTNQDIGKALARLAAERYQFQPRPSQDRLRTRAQRRYMEKNFPILHERMKGVAAAFGHAPDDDAFGHCDLDFTDLRAGCSVVHLPPGCTTSGTGVVSRDYDYSTGSLTFGFLPPGKLHPTARPYLMEFHPDRGYASVAMVAYDLLSGALDGMNSEGLTVALAMDDEMFTRHALEPTQGPAPGLGVLQVPRLLLDTCATVEEAKEALLETKQYYEYIPVHYLIADRFGNAFVWEYSHAHNKEYIIENPDRPLVMTNFSLNRHLDNNRPPSVEQVRGVCKRYCLLTEQLGAAPGKLSEEFIKETHKKVDAALPAAAEPQRPPVRTFWHALYHPSERRVQISFYLHDETVPGKPDQVRIVRSPYLEFGLEPTNLGKAPPASQPPDATAVPSGPVAAGKLDADLQEVVTQLKKGGALLRIEGQKVEVVVLDKAGDLTPLLPLLHKLPDLGEMSIRTRKLDDAGMAVLGGLQKLYLLNLNTSAVGDDGLKVVAKLPRLRTLLLGSTRVTDAGLAHLEGQTQLENLSFQSDPVTDAGLAHLAGLTTITGLNLKETKVTDAGLVHLKAMSRLTKLNLAGTSVTDEGVAKIKSALPFWIRIER
jgi:predicted choloylglycine hydrolase